MAHYGSLDEVQSRNRILSDKLAAFRDGRALQVAEPGTGMGNYAPDKQFNLLYQAAARSSAIPLPANGALYDGVYDMGLPSARQYNSVIPRMSAGEKIAEHFVSSFTTPRFSLQDILIFGLLAFLLLKILAGRPSGVWDQFGPGTSLLSPIVRGGSSYLF